MVAEEGKYKQLKGQEETKPNGYKTMKSEPGLQLFEDVEFYKSKAAKQMKEKQALDAEDQLIAESLRTDLAMGNKVSDVFLDDVVFPGATEVKRKMDLKETSFGRQQQQQRSMVERLSKLGLDFTQEDITTLSREDLFEDKRLLEEQLNFQKYLHRKEKKRHMKK